MQQKTLHITLYIKIIYNTIYTLPEIFATTRGIQYFCPFAFKARRTAPIFVECITVHQTSLLDDVHKVLAVFTGHKLCFVYVFEYTSHKLKYSRSGLILTLKLPAWKSFLWLRK